MADLEPGPFGGLAGFLVVEDAPSAGGGERVELAFQVLPADRDPGAADADLAAAGREGGQRAGMRL
ncbi:hypothetical protein [Spongiactinospora sp. 9N601]|uniref:hypothetical protein n=1 Tax=Spongiactinospora sp. 9N601 TaxID=3375149 RepID=UPI00378BB49E